MALSDKGARRLVLLALLLCTALILSYVEALIPTGFLRLGLANIAVMLTSFLLSRREGLLVMLCRVVISSILFGSAASLAFSLCGGFLAWCVMAALKPIYGKISLIGVSVLAAAAHNVGQVLAAVLVLGSPAPLGMLWWLLLLSVPAGLLTGIPAEIVSGRIGTKFN